MSSRTEGGSNLLTRPPQLAPLPINTPLHEPQAQGVAILFHWLSLLPCSSSCALRLLEAAARVREARLVSRAVSLTTACRCHGVPLHVGPKPTLRRGIQRLVGGVISAESKDVFIGGLLVARLAYKMQIQLYQVSGACVHVHVPSQVFAHPIRLAYK